MNGDVVVGVNRKRFHVSPLFPVAYSRMDIDHSGRRHKQADSAGNPENSRMTLLAGAAT
jgi:hypothetical protein